MYILKRPLAMVSLLTCAMFLLAGTAFATTVYDGADYSYGGNNRVVICDRESDADRANVTALLGNNSYAKTYDGDGAFGNCYRSPYYGNVVGHKTCESHAQFPDTCGPWSYNGH